MTQNNDDLTARVIRLDELVSYQPGAVVSRMLMFKKSGTITVFAFDTGQGLSEHTAPFDAVLAVIDGTAEVTISGIAFSLRQGDTIIMPARKPHAVKAITRFKMVLTMIHE